ncbi:hypothetical protein Baya_14867 [Bagarius yarrelli]|uniref:Uncharacterized protein n=1 Tax=Bagarius yarrelli TaxID=175774 RepID=A0A556VA46_BAGYA|nr:hypothetical protein Baya_14867 [Bagarius yarrelli]
MERFFSKSALKHQKHQMTLYQLGEGLSHGAVQQTCAFICDFPEDKASEHAALICSLKTTDIFSKSVQQLRDQGTLCEHWQITGSAQTLQIPSAAGFWSLKSESPVNAVPLKLEPRLTRPPVEETGVQDGDRVVAVK